MPTLKKETQKELVRVSRTIHYYDLKFSKQSGLKPTEIISKVFNMANQLDKKADAGRFDSTGVGEKNCVRDITFFGDKNNFIRGKFLRLRQDVFPEVFKENLNTLIEITAEEEDSVAETTHFLLDFRTSKICIALESNGHGPKIVDVVSYINKMLGMLNIQSLCQYEIRVKDDLDSFIRRINRCSEFYASVHKNEIKRIASIDQGLFSAMKAAEEYGHSETVVIRLKFDWRKRTSTPFTQKVKKIIGKLRKNKNDKDVFDALIVRAEDEDRNNRLQAFDLLSDKVISVINVQRKHKTKVIVSADIYERLHTEYLKTMK